jgi:hypothetical protein
MTLKQVASDLADQRYRVAEQSARLVEARRRWLQERVQSAGWLEAFGQHLQSRLQGLAVQEERCGQWEAELQLRYQNHQGAEAQLRIQASAWEAERDKAVADLHAREQAVAKWASTLKKRRQSLKVQQEHHLESLRRANASCERARLQYFELRTLAEDRLKQLVREQRRVAEQALAIEQYRQEVIVQGADAVATDKRLAVLRRNLADLTAASENDLGQRQEDLAGEFARLNEHHRQLHAQLERSAAITKREAEWEQQHAVFEEESNRLRHELHRMRSRQTVNERQIEELTDEVERLTRALMEDAPPSNTVGRQAA